MTDFFFLNFVFFATSGHTPKGVLIRKQMLWQEHWAFSTGNPTALQCSSYPPDVCFVLPKLSDACQQNGEQFCVCAGIWLTNRTLLEGSPREPTLGRTQIHLREWRGLELTSTVELHLQTRDVPFQDCPSSPVHTPPPKWNYWHSAPGEQSYTLSKPLKTCKPPKQGQCCYTAKQKHNKKNAIFKCISVLFHE